MKLLVIGIKSARAELKARPKGPATNKPKIPVTTGVLFLLGLFSKSTLPRLNGAVLTLCFVSQGCSHFLLCSCSF